MLCDHSRSNHDICDAACLLVAAVYYLALALCSLLPMIPCGCITVDEPRKLSRDMPKREKRHVCEIEVHRPSLPSLQVKLIASPQLEGTRVLS